MTTKLMPDTHAPRLKLPLAGGGTFDLSAETPENFTMVVFYRGFHCPICKDYLGKLESLLDGYKDAGFAVVAVSMDGEERANKAKDEWNLPNLRIAYDLDEATARDWGLWLSNSIKEAEASIFTEPGLFWVRPDGNLYLIDISTMPIARPDLEFMLGKAPFLMKNNYPARGTRLAA